MMQTAFIISVYKNDKLDCIKEMLESLFKQTMQDFHIYIQQDGKISKDVEEYLDSLFISRRIFYLGKRNINKGLAFSLNELIEVALQHDYQYLFRMDADDICHPERVTLQYKFMEENKAIDIVGSWMEEFNEDTGEQSIIKYPEKHSDIFDFMKTRCPLAHVTVCFRTSFFQKAGRYNIYTIRNEDLDLWIRGFETGCIFHNLQLPLVKVRVDNSFYERRAGYEKALNDCFYKWKATRLFSFGLVGYIYAIGTFFLLQLPPGIKKYLYKKLR